MSRLACGTAADWFFAFSTNMGAWGTAHGEVAEARLLWVCASPDASRPQHCLHIAGARGVAALLCHGAPCRQAEPGRGSDTPRISARRLDDRWEGTFITGKKCNTSPSHTFCDGQPAGSQQTHRVRASADAAAAAAAAATHGTPAPLRCAAEACALPPTQPSTVHLAPRSSGLPCAWRCCSSTQRSWCWQAHRYRACKFLRCVCARSRASPPPAGSMQCAAQCRLGAAGGVQRMCAWSSTCRAASKAQQLGGLPCCHDHARLSPHH